MDKTKYGATAASMQEELPEDIRTGLSPETLKHAIVDNLLYRQGRLPESATRNDWYMALAYDVRCRWLDRRIPTVRTFMKNDVKVVGYLSAEFLMGPHLENNLINLGIYEQAGEAVRDLGLDLNDLIGQEEEPGLGNGGLGRLAACYLD